MSGGPERVFARLRSVPVPPELLDDLSRSVAFAVRREGRPRPATRLHPAVAWAASILLAAALVLAGRRGPDLGHRVVASDTPRAEVVVTGGSPGARVVDMMVGDVQVVMVYDAGIDL